MERWQLAQQTQRHRHRRLNDGISSRQWAAANGDLAAGSRKEIEVITPRCRCQDETEIGRRFQEPRVHLNTGVHNQDFHTPQVQ